MEAFCGLSLFNINNCLSAKPDPAQLEQAVCLILECHRAISVWKSVEFASWLHFWFPRSAVVIPTPSNSDTNASIKADSYTHAKVAPHRDSKGEQETAVQAREFVEINALQIKGMKS